MKTNADYVVIDRSKLLSKLYDLVNQEALIADENDLTKWVRENEEMFLTIPEFQRDMYENTVRWFPSQVAGGQIDLNMIMYGIAGEAGECAEAMKKFVRGDYDSGVLRDKLAEESVDLFHYICMLWMVLQIDAGEVYMKKTVENEKRFGPKIDKVNGQA